MTWLTPVRPISSGEYVFWVTPGRPRSGAGLMVNPPVVPSPKLAEFADAPACLAVAKGGHGGPPPQAAKVTAYARP
jgi:hypothetical protein